MENFQVYFTNKAKNEIFYDSVPFFVTALSCGEGQFLCGNERACIDEKFVCDEEDDCEDGSDESNCGMF